MAEDTKEKGIQERPVQVFISYAQEDSDVASRLEKHLAGLLRKGQVSRWYDRRIVAGTDWKSEIHQRLNSSQIILFLVSVDFIASDYCYGVEMSHALQRHDTGVAVVIPIIVRPVDWHSAPFSKLQVLPRDEKPVTLSQSQDDALATIVSDLQPIIRTFQAETLPIVAAGDREIELTIDQTFDSYTIADQNRLLRAIQELLKLKSDIQITHKDRGSVKLRLRFSAEEVSLLYRTSRVTEVGGIGQRFQPKEHQVLILG